MVKVNSIHVLILLFFLLLFHSSHAQVVEGEKEIFKVILDSRDCGHMALSIPTYYSNKGKIKVYKNGQKLLISINDFSEIVYINSATNDSVTFVSRNYKNKTTLFKKMDYERVQFLERSQSNLKLRLVSVVTFSLILGAVTDSEYGLIAGVPIGILLVDPLINRTSTFFELNGKIIKVKSKRGKSLLM